MSTPFFTGGGRRAILNVVENQNGIGWHHDGDWTFMAEKSQRGLWMQAFEGQTKRFEGPFRSWVPWAKRWDFS